MDIVKTGSTWVLRTAPILDATGARLTGLTDIKFSVSRYTSGAWQWLDTADSTFRASPAGYQFTMVEVDATKAPGVYAYALDTSTITNVTFGDQLFVDIQQTTLTNAINANQAGGGVYGYVVDKVESNLTVATSTLATPTNITAGTITTVTNLTNAPTAGDFTATMKASITTAATAATPTAAAVSGSVGSIASGGITAASIASNAITSAKIATDAIGAAQLAADAVTEIQTGLATSAPLHTPEVIEVGQTETVPVIFDYVLNGAPVTGATVLLFVDRVVAGVLQRLDWDFETFGSPGAAVMPSLTMSELDAVNAPGVYYALWDSTFPNNATYPCVYFLTIKVGSTVLARREIRVRTVDTLNTAAANVATILGYGAAPSAATVSAAVVDQALAGHTTAGTVGEALSHADVATSTRLASASYSAPPSAATISTQVNADITTAHGAGSYQTASTAGLATATDVTNAVTAIDAHTDSAVSPLATAAALAAVQADTDDLQTRLPAALVGGRIDASVGAMAADVLTSSALAGSAVTEIQTGLATAAALATAQGNITTILGYGAPPTAAANAAAVWATTEGSGTMGASLALLRRRATNKRHMSGSGVISFYADDGSTVEKTVTITDKDGVAIVVASGDPARSSAET